MEIKIFYSWQSDNSIPNKVNWTFIEDALRNAVKKIAKDDSIDVVPVIDRDTQGKAGAISVIDTILNKIETSHIFVCDVTIVNKGSKFRQTPNPNVMYELGYAMKHLGESKIIMVVNTAYGRIEDLPFDIRHRRPITYNLCENDAEKSNTRTKLERSLEYAIRSIIIESNLHKKESDEIQPENIEDSFVTRLKNIEAQKDYKWFQQHWVSTDRGIEDVRISMNQICQIIDERFNPHAEIYAAQGIGLITGEYLRSIENNKYSCMVRIVNYFDRPLNQIHPLLFLEIKLSAKKTYTSEHFFHETIKYVNLIPDINFERTIFWKDIKNENSTYTPKEITDKCFELFFNQIENPAQTIEEKNRRRQENMPRSHKLRSRR